MASANLYDLNVSILKHISRFCIQLALATIAQIHISLADPNPWLLDLASSGMFTSRYSLIYALQCLQFLQKISKFINFINKRLKDHKNFAAKAYFEI